MNTPNPGEVFESRYQVRSVLGQGGFATVYLAWDPKTGRNVVLKVLSPDPDGTYPSTIATRFQREAALLATFSEPHIVTLYDFGRASNGLLYMVFEHVEGRELTTLLNEPMPPALAQHIVVQLLEALRESHRHGILHRDLKPANVLVYAYDGDPHRVKLIDFGIAKDITADTTRLTRTGNVVGTLRYMSPEQVFGEPLTPATDIFCLGMIAWEMLMGRPLIDGADRGEMLSQHANLTAIFLDVKEPTAFHDAVLRALQLEPSQRFASADAMLSAIRSPHVVAPSRQPRPPAATDAPSAKHPMIPLFLGVVVGALAVLVGWVLLHSQSESAPAVPEPTAGSRNVAALTEPPPADEPGESEAVQPVVDVSDKCRRPPPFQGFGRLGPTLTGGRVSSYIPTRYDPKQPPGLVVALHRRFRTGMDMLKYTEIAEHAEKHNWVVIAPDASALADWATDPNYVLYAIETAIAELCIDRTQLHVLGDEAGVGYARRVACRIPVSSLVAAYDPGNFNQCKPSESFPYMRIYTLQDTFHPAAGNGCKSDLVGEFSSWEGIHGSIHKRMRCPEDGPSEPWEPYDDACNLSTACPSPVVVCAFEGGHRWPASPDANPLQYNGCDDPETTAPLMSAAAQFMSMHGRTLTAEQIRATDEVLGLVDSKAAQPGSATPSE